MKKRIVIGVIIAFLIGGGAVYFLTKSDKKDNSETKANSNSSQSSSGSDFAPVSTKGLDFTATITSTGASGESTAKIEQDGDKTRYVATADGQETQVIYTSDAYYTCTNGQCYKFAKTQSANSGVDVGSYEYDESEIANFRNTAAYKGKQDCPAGTCDVWSVTTAEETSTLYIDSKTKRISQVEGTNAGVTSKIVYDYKDVTIDVPQNAQTLQTP